MGIKEFLAKSLTKDSRFKELEKEMKMQKLLEERQKNSNERELERFYEEERQKSIKQNLEEFRKKQKEETWHGKTILSTPNIFKGQSSIMKSDHNIMDSGRGILHDKKLFTVKSNRGGFFKR